MDEPNLERLAEDPAWRKREARDLTMWLVALTAPACTLFRPAYAARVAFYALTRKKANRG